MAEQKAHQPTSRKLKRARADGKVLKSPLLTTSIAIIGCIFGVLYVPGFLWLSNKMLLEYTLEQALHHPEVLVRPGGVLIFQCVCLTLLPGAVAAFCIEIWQVGWKIELKPLVFKAERLSIAAGWKRFGSGLRGIWISALKIVLMISVICWCARSSLIVAYNAVGNILPQLRQIFVATAENILIAGCLLLLIVGMLEFLLKRREFYRELSMSSDEIRREFRESEGDPGIRSARRALHREMVMQDLVKRVRRARVIVVEKL
jgi:type III secretion protein U